VETRHAWVAAQAGQVPPPQSTVVSAPLRTESPQLGAWQTLPAQTWLLQSVETRHAWVAAQAGQVPPPQSTAVSAPLRTESLQLGAWQTLPVQTWLVQSATTPQR
jgi:hypothetical protein